MAKKSDKERVADWQLRIRASNKVFEKWEKRFMCKTTPLYYEGFQWNGDFKPGTEPYTINLVFPTIEIQLPSLLFFHPKITVRPRPNRVDDAGSAGAVRAQLREDTINTVISSRRVGFNQEIEQAHMDAYFYFGIVETGYTADAADNPNAGKPILNERDEDTGKTYPEGAKIVSRESLYFKRVPPEHFRVSLSAGNRLEQCDWYGYYEWMYPADVKANKRYKNTTNLKATGKISDSLEPEASNDEEKEKYKDMAKVWKIWDLRAKKRYDFAEGGEKFLLEEDMDLRPDKSPILQHSVLKKHERRNEFYPLPPVFNWISPQNELNETRQMQRIYRKKLVPKFAADASVDDVEVAKFLEADIQVIRCKENGITPIAMPPSDGALLRAIPVTQDDFRQISGVGGEQRGIADADTATQANIIDVQSKIRESMGRVKVAAFIASLGETAIEILQKRATLPFWIQTNVDPEAMSAPAEISATTATWQMITSDKLGDLDTDVTVDAESLAPVSDPAERAAWNQVITLMMNPQIFPILASSDVLLRKTLAYYGIRSDKEISEIRRIGTIMFQMMAAQVQAQQAAAQGAQERKHVIQGQTAGAIPGQDQINGQIQAQTPQ